MWTQADFDYWYSPVKARVPNGHPEHGNSFPYGWKYFAYGSRRALDGSSEELGYADNFRWVQALVNRAGYAPGKKALIVGCGVGATVYKVRSDYPVANIWGTDTSAYVHSIKNVNSPAGFVPDDYIMNVDILAQNALTQLKAYTGGNGKVDWVICELVTETIPVQDRSAWFAACESLLAANGNVVHIVMSNRDGSPAPADWLTEGWTWQTISQWGAESPSHYFIDASDTSLVYSPGG